MGPMLSLLKTWCADLADLVAPRVCLACADPLVTVEALCPRCREHLMPAVDAPLGVHVAWDHGGPLVRAIHRAKYGDDPAVAASLGALLAEAWRAPEGFVATRVVPVPLHPARLRQRGFNQSAELARALAQQLDAPLAWRAVERVRDTPSQTRLDRGARRENVRSVFRANGSLRGHHVVLVDDVVTTGATLSELRDAVLAAGATAVCATALARAPLLFTDGR